MRFITLNLLNRFWKKGITPIKKLLGDEDISKIGDGTVTGALSELNTGLVNLSDLSLSPSAKYPGDDFDANTVLYNSLILAGLKSQNTPLKTDGYLLTFRISQAYVLQLWFPLFSADPIYFRTKGGTTFGNWKTV